MNFSKFLNESRKKEEKELEIENKEFLITFGDYDVKHGDIDLTVCLHAPTSNKKFKESQEYKETYILVSALAEIKVGKDDEPTGFNSNTGGVSYRSYSTIDGIDTDTLKVVVESIEDSIPEEEFKEDYEKALEYLKSIEKDVDKGKYNDKIADAIDKFVEKNYEDIKDNM